jgi:endonuclease/exonuclease/phosphatase family metal-dependent hydrolase
MRAVTWNAQHGLGEDGGPALAAGLSALGALRGDVVAIQELDRGRSRSGRQDQPAAVAAALGGELVWAPALTTGGEYGIALVVQGLVHRPVIHRLPGRGEPRVAVLAEVDAGGLRCTVAATHLATSRTTAVQQLLVVLDLLRGRPGPHVLLGDLNLEPPALLPWTTAEGFDLVTGPPTHSTRRPQPARRIDHVVLSRDLAPDASVVRHLPASDHLAVVVDLRPRRGSRPT